MRTNLEALSAWRSTGEPLPYLAMAGPLGKASLTIHREDAPPKEDGAGIALVLDDLPLARESIEDQPRRVAAYP